MYAKLLKHELRATGRLLGLLTAAALSLGVAGGLVLRLLIVLISQEGENPLRTIISSGLVISLVFMGIALVVYASVTQLYLYWRFYKHKFTDQGYLTFTLPVGCGEIWMSSYVSMLIWSVISVLVVSISFGGIALIGAGEFLLEEETRGWIKIFAESLLEAYQEVGSIALPVTVIVLSFLASPAIIMSCITLGAVLAKKHKLLAAFGIYYGVSTVLSMLQSILSVILGLTELSDPVMYLNLALLLPAVLTAALAVAGSLLSIWLTKNKLNLP